ncbi:3'(2'),5'-bisphosphate nucleotidase CysQ [uncultured Corynebacterium sp.]|uniref:3'(2'),5'-bisphosphate nucleotidase CysQ n=1 Tax=uncultured Corynebacterium sp. TaxID=159447 RepID=UPI0025F5660A|nr:3'(2'),5'-bisphosphate nucleotidase CysQ [uncultured Corynebacterium sp.]
MSAYVDDDILTLRLAQGTGEILKGVRNVGLLRGRVLGDAGDALSQEWISRVLEQHRPDDAVLSEEAADNRRRLDNSRVWIIDPLDGTREFASGRQDWAVHIALIEDGVPKHAAVGLPDLGQVFHTGEAKAVTGPMSNKIVVSRTRPPEVGKFVAEKLGREVVHMGSAGAKAMHVLLGDVDAYIHAGGQYEWDSAAPVGVCQAAGLHVSRLDGSKPKYNNPDTFMPDMLFCRPEIADEILEAVAEYSKDHGEF